jgi:predicted Zn-dependent protease
MLERCLAADPAFEMTYVVLTRLLMQSGQREKALGVLQQLLQRNPRHPAALELLAQARAAGAPIR